MNVSNSLIENEKLVELIRNGQKEHLEQLYLQNKPMIYKIIRKCGIYSCSDTEDALQNGYIGLHNAAVTYDKHKGVKFVTYAYKLIFHAILTGVCVGNSVYMPSNVYFLWYKIQREKKRLIEENQDATAAELSKLCNVPEEHINIISAAANGTISLNKPIDGVDGEISELGDRLKDNTINIAEDEENKELKSLILRVLNELLTTERKVIIYRFIYNKTLCDTAKLLYINESDARRLEGSALRKLRHYKNKHLFECYI